MFCAFAYQMSDAGQCALSCQHKSCVRVRQKKLGSGLHTLMRAQSTGTRACSGKQELFLKIPFHMVIDCPITLHVQAPKQARPD